MALMQHSVLCSVAIMEFDFSFYLPHRRAKWCLLVHVCFHSGENCVTKCLQRPSPFWESDVWWTERELRSFLRPNAKNLNLCDQVPCWGDLACILFWALVTENLCFCTRCSFPLTSQNSLFNRKHNPNAIPVCGLYSKLEGVHMWFLQQSTRQTSIPPTLVVLRSQELVCSRQIVSLFLNYPVKQNTYDIAAEWWIDDQQMKTGSWKNKRNCSFWQDILHQPTKESLSSDILWVKSQHGSKRAGYMCVSQNIYSVLYISNQSQKIIQFNCHMPKANLWLTNALFIHPEKGDSCRTVALSVQGMTVQMTSPLLNSVLPEYLIPERIYLHIAQAQILHKARKENTKDEKTWNDVALQTSSKARQFLSDTKKSAHKQETHRADNNHLYPSTS